MTIPELLVAAKLVLVAAAPTKPRRRTAATAIEADLLEARSRRFI